MSSTASVQRPLDPAIIGFEKAMREFKVKLNDDAMYVEILKIRSIDQVYDIAEAIQAEQAKTGHLRHLAKIEKYLERMKLYTDAIDTFVSAKPDILALIWGPMKLLIQWTSTLSKSQDAIAKITAEIGDLLPEFHGMTALFSHNKRLNDVMALFFQDILDFYLISLRLFSKTRLKYVLEALWPKEKGKIELVKSHIERHATLMRIEVRLEHIREEHEARVRAMEHFEKTEREHMRQEYHRILTGINPRFYDSKLDEIAGRQCAGTGEWLLRNDKFGKTCQGLGKRVVCAFLTHSFSASTSALSVLHSFIFQLARTTDDLQGALCHSSRQDLKSSLDCAAEVLTSLVDFAGPTWFVVDGLDELDLIERLRLLSQLVELAKECETLRILICSRAESDIERALGTSPRVRVDHSNSHSIEVFVKYETTQWLSRKYFGHQELTEIEGLLAPLASKANGMFLYAKVVFSCLDLLSDVREVRKELLVLPKDLNDAYSRILQRINNISSPRARTKARLLLGFIGCSPVPLTVYELDQLLTIDLYEGLEKSTNPNICSLNPIVLCGPIVEIADEYVQFVHFTVQEYFFSPDIAGFLDKPAMLLQLTASCLNYLCQDHHSPDLSRDKIEKATMSGLYQLHPYADVMWYELVDKSLALHDCKGVLGMLEKFATERLREDLEEMDDSLPPLEKPEIKQLEEHQPRVYQLLMRTSEFRRRCESSDFETGNSSGWKGINPLRTSDLYVQIREAFDRLLCGSTTHSQTYYSYVSLRSMYGSRMFKCPYLGCPMRSRGFESNSLRRSHIAHHSRPWKCDVAGCEYAETGFLSRRMQNDHLDNFHREDETGPHSTADKLTDIIPLGKPDTDEIEAVFRDLILADRTEELKSLVDYFKNFGSDNQKKIIQEAAAHASARTVAFMMDLVKETTTQEYLEKMPPTLLFCACKGNNLEVLEWVLKNTNLRVPGWNYFPRVSITGWRYMGWDDVLVLAIESESRRMFQDLLPEFIVEFTTSRSETPICPAARAMTLHVIKACAGRPDSEERLQILRDSLHALYRDDKVHGHESLSGRYSITSYFGHALGFITDTICSIKLAKALLGYGVKVDYSAGGSTYRTPLHRTLRKSNPQTAAMARFLLYRDADPESTSNRSSVKLIKDEVGAREISKWIGITWDELVQKVKEDREAGICPPEYL
ncbi:hypothetical protein V8F33_009789 [Rhypophila sp. PSN 637]